ncbi:hypothetical protein CHH55_12180 [Niallia circulans]|uniref:hypothetical protein n=1 Tax=Niallia circulans TaxID=1397 RepID=UPI000BA5DA73|nr:hypothetical protein [Niallia circulans]PAD87626.1 hypothetical protein CHH55_12180 [Niallia circulans]
MELVLKKQRIRSTKNTWTGLVSFLLSLVALTGINLGLIFEVDIFPELVFTKIPFISLLLGIIGLFTRNGSRAFAIIGISLSVFIFVFFIMMFGLAWTINPKP